MEVLQVGDSILIKRSDGRTHAAIVSAIDFDSSTVKVEWFEGGETKGKELDFVQVTNLNPNVRLNRSYTNLDSRPRRRQSMLSDRSVQIPTKVRHTNVSHNGLKTNDDITSNIPIAHRNSSRSMDRRAQSASSKLQCVELLNKTSSEVNLTVQGQSFVPLSPARSNSESMTDNSTLRKAGRLQKAREARRRKAAEMKAERIEMCKKYQENPHYELLNMINEYCKTLDYNPLNLDDSIEDHLITVAVRKRPLNRADIQRREVDIVTIPSKRQLIVHEPKYKVDLTKYLENHVFMFDYTFNEFCTNEMVYKYTAQPLVKTIFEGGFATCFAYGQTGSGKTYTMSGNDYNSEKGIYVLAAADIFRLVDSTKYKHMNFTVSCSFFEIYTKKVHDLLNNKNELRILEDGKQQVQIVGLTEHVVCNVTDVLKLINMGNLERASGQTSANMHSSRSHAIFQLYLRAAMKPKNIYGKFSLIDLAGNERGADTFSASRVTRLEGSEINQSLLALKECIRALGRKGGHLPFRTSKLTQVLRDSFVGAKSKTCMIAMVSPGVSSCENTLNTLRYADRVKELGGGDVLMTRHDYEEWRNSSSDRISNPGPSTSTKTQIPVSRFTMLKYDQRILNAQRDLVDRLRKSAYEVEQMIFDGDIENNIYRWHEIIEQSQAYLKYFKEIFSNYDN